MIGGGVPIVTFDPYVEIAPTRETPSRDNEREYGRIKMRKTILTILGSALIAASAIQAAAATERHHVRKANRAPVQATQSYRDSNASIWTAPQAQPDYERYQNGAMSAPAGH